MFQFSSCTRFDEFPNGGLRVVLPGKKCIDYVEIEWLLDIFGYVLEGTDPE